MTSCMRHPTCRICCDANIYALNRLIAPCNCNGSMRFIHVKCLEKWIKSRNQGQNIYQCEICRQIYKIRLERTCVCLLDTVEQRQALLGIIVRVSVALASVGLIVLLFVEMGKPGVFAALNFKTTCLIAFLTFLVAMINMYEAWRAIQQYRCMFLMFLVFLLKWIT